MNEIFGQGTASYIEVRDEFTGDEFLAWLEYVARWDVEAKHKAAQDEHDALMRAAAKAL